MTTALRVLEHLVVSEIGHQVALQMTEHGAMDTIIELFETMAKILERPWLEGRFIGSSPNCV